MSNNTGAGKGSELRKGANLNAYWSNYDDIFRRPKSNVYNVQVLTSSGWETKNTLETLDLAKVYYYGIGESNAWKGYARIECDGQSIISTLDARP